MRVRAACALRAFESDARARCGGAASALSDVSSLPHAIAAPCATVTRRCSSLRPDADGATARTAMLRDCVDTHAIFQLRHAARHGVAHAAVAADIIRHAIILPPATIRRHHADANMLRDAASTARAMRNAMQTALMRSRARRAVAIPSLLRRDAV